MNEKFLYEKYIKPYESEILDYFANEDIAYFKSNVLPELIDDALDGDVYAVDMLENYDYAKLAEHIDSYTGGFGMYADFKKLFPIVATNVDPDIFACIGIIFAEGSYNYDDYEYKMTKELRKIIRQNFN